MRQFFSRRRDAVSVIDAVVATYGKKAAANPNLLEFNGHRLLLQQKQPAAATAASAAMRAVRAVRAAPRCGCSGRAVMSSIAINRVQSTYHTPVYKLPRGEGGVLDLDDKLWSSWSCPHHPSLTSKKKCHSFGNGGGNDSTGDAIVADGNGEKERRQGQGTAVGNNAASAAASQSCWRGEGSNEQVAGEGGDGGKGGGFDRSAYRQRAFNSVHIGELWVEEQGEKKGGVVVVAGLDSGSKKVNGRGGAQAEGEGVDEKETELIQLDGVAVEGEIQVSTTAALEKGGNGRRCGCKPDDKDSNVVGRPYGDDANHDHHLSRALTHVAETKQGPPVVDIGIGVASSNSSSITCRTGVIDEELPITTVTVLLPVKNGGSQLLDAVESVVACVRETPPDWQVELLIIDDGSEDGAVKLAVAAVSRSCATSFTEKTSSRAPAVTERQTSPMTSLQEPQVGRPDGEQLVGGEKEGNGGGKGGQEEGSRKGEQSNGDEERQTTMKMTEESKGGLISVVSSTAGDYGSGDGCGGIFNDNGIFTTVPADDIQGVGVAVNYRQPVADDGAGDDSGVNAVISADGFAADKNNMDHDDGNVNNDATAVANDQARRLESFSYGSHPPHCRRHRWRMAVRVIRHDRTLGLAESLNEGLKEARSDLVARLDADDVCMPDRLRRQVCYYMYQLHLPLVRSFCVADIYNDCGGC